MFSHQLPPKRFGQNGLGQPVDEDPGPVVVGVPDSSTLRSPDIIGLLLDAESLPLGAFGLIPEFPVKPLVNLSLYVCRHTSHSLEHALSGFRRRH